MTQQDQREEQHIPQHQHHPQPTQVVSPLTGKVFQCSQNGGGGVLVPFDDGHTPMTFLRARDSSSSSLSIVERSDAVQQDGGLIVKDQSRSAPKLLSIVQDALPEELTDALYQTSVDAGSTGSKTWGTYVSMEEATQRASVLIAMKRHKAAQATKNCSEQDHDEERKVEILCNQTKPQHFQDKDTSSTKCTSSSEEERHGLAVDAVTHFLLLHRQKHDNSNAKSDNDSEKIKDTNKDGSSYQVKNPTIPNLLEEVHGVAVWALAASPNTQVSYHIDYAELLRYEFNAIVPPLYAGTIQCTRLNSSATTTELGLEDGNHQDADKSQEKKLKKQEDEHIMVGGDFMVNTQGLDHYARYGYKCKKKSMSWQRQQDDSWVKVPYKYNQGILHDGDFPHLSTPIQKLCKGKKRVILGLNLFGYDSGPLVSSAPEHSQVYNRRVKWYQMLSKMKWTGLEKASDDGQRSDELDKSTAQNDKNSQGDDTSKLSVPQDAASMQEPQQGMTLNAIRNNKPLMKLLVLAKREKERQTHFAERREVEKMLLQRLQNENEDVHVSVAQLVQQERTKEDGIEQETVRLHLTRMVRDENWREDFGIIVSCSGPSCDDDEAGVWYDERGLVKDDVYLKRRI